MPQIDAALMATELARPCPGNTALSGENELALLSHVDGRN